MNKIKSTIRKMKSVEVVIPVYKCVLWCAAGFLAGKISKAMWP